MATKTTKRHFKVCKVLRVGKLSQNSQFSEKHEPRGFETKSCNMFILITIYLTCIR